MRPCLLPPGIPYWSEDIGGFFRPEDQYTSPDYHDLLVRWLQFGAFTPLYRIHGGGSNTEIWNYGPDVQQRFLDITNLRYRLLPYIYSGAWQVATGTYSTLQRLLDFDFPTDPRVGQVADQFMWGPALLVSPVHTPATTSREVYLPVLDGATAHWTEFWTGEVLKSNQTVTSAAPIDRIPVHVRSGAILPLGPLLQYSDEKPADPVELRVYSGADGR